MIQKTGTEMYRLFCALKLTLLFIRLEFQYIFVIMSKEDSKEEGP